MTVLAAVLTGPPLAELLDGSYIPTGSIKTAVALLEQHAA